MRSAGMFAPTPSAHGNGNSSPRLPQMAAAGVAAQFLPPTSESHTHHQLANGLPAPASSDAYDIGSAPAVSPVTGAHLPAAAELVSRLSQDDRSTLEAALLGARSASPTSSRPLQVAVASKLVSAETARLAMLANKRPFADEPELQRLFDKFLKHCADQSDDFLSPVLAPIAAHNANAM